MTTISGMSFYDSLNKLIVGILLLFPVVKCFGISEESYSQTLFYIFAFIIGCVYQAGVRSLTPCWTLNENELAKACKTEEIKRDKKIKERYYDAYYAIAKEGLLLNIPVLEALENFMRNIPWIILLYLVMTLAGCSPLSCLLCMDNCVIAVVLTVLIIATIKLRFYYQQEVYRLVWEADEYLSKNKKGKNDKEN